MAHCSICNKFSGKELMHPGCFQAERARVLASFTTAFCPDCSEEIDVPEVGGHRTTCPNCGLWCVTDIDGEDNRAGLKLLRAKQQQAHIIDLGALAAKERGL